MIISRRTWQKMTTIFFLQYNLIDVQVPYAVPDSPLGDGAQSHQGHRLQEVQLDPDIRHSGRNYFLFE